MQEQEIEYYYNRAVFKIHAQKASEFTIVMKDCFVQLKNNAVEFPAFFVDKKAASPLNMHENISIKEWKSSDDGPYFLITARVPINKFDNTQSEYIHDELNSLINTAVSVLGALYNPQVIGQEVFRGPVPLSENPPAYISFVVAPLIPFLGCSPKLIGEIFNKAVAEKAKNNDANKLSLMGSLLTAANSRNSLEETIVWLWTILEVHPMSGTRHIKHVREFVHRITKKPPKEIEEKLKIGNLFGYRSEILHLGTIENTRLAKIEAVNLLFKFSAGCYARLSWIAVRWAS